jgi:hypothetical protein
MGNIIAYSSVLACVVAGPVDGEGGRVVLSPLDQIQPGRSDWVLAEHGGLGGLSATDTTNAAKTEPKDPPGGPGKVCRRGSGSVGGLGRQ